MTDRRQSALYMAAALIALALALGACASRLIGSTSLTAIREASSTRTWTNSLPAPQVLPPR
ncbi:hypothetical protein [Chelatococcus reniformis]|uniref:hypothetical protein n=1 Tax=Chelatococcus reniformis TaxID=1494448 RepID=UPI0016665C0A|nr:hypothetical protein [Chelatococcus reniformis]